MVHLLENSKRGKNFLWELAAFSYSRRKSDMVFRMGSLISIISLFLLMTLASCQVKDAASNGGLISGHTPTTNKFTLVPPANMTYNVGETLTLTVSFPFDIIADTTSGTPRLRLLVGATTRYATYSPQGNPKRLVFTYTFISGDNDTNGIDVVALELNGSTLQFDDDNDGTATNCDVSTITSTNFPNLRADTADPTVTAFSLINLPDLYTAGEDITFRVTFSENVYVTGTPKFTMSLSGTLVDVEYSSGSGTTDLLFNYTVGMTVADTNGYNAINPITGGTIKDSIGNDANSDFSAFVAAVITYSNSVDVNGQYPTIVATQFPANGTYLAAQNLDFIFEFDRPVTVTGATTPYIPVTIGGNVRQAQYQSGNGTEFLTFRYVTIPGDVSNGITVPSAITQNAGNIQVTGSAPAVYFFTDARNNTFSVPNTTGIIINAIQPQATSVTRDVDVSPAVWGTALDNVWIPGQNLNITVGFNTPMYVTQTNGTPTLAITVGATPQAATYLSGGNGQTALVFRYTVQQNDLDTDGTISIGNISLNGGVITDISGTNTLLTMPVAGITNTRIDGVRPTILSIAAPANGTYSQVSSTYTAATMSFVVTWSEAVNYSATGIGAAYLSMDTGGTTVQLNWATGSNTATMTHRPMPTATALAGRNDADGVTLTSPLAGTANIRDQAGNVANVLTYTPPTTTGILVDTTNPTVSSVTAITADGTYTVGDNIDFSVTFSEPVTTLVNATHPRIALTVGGATRYLLPTASTTSTNHTFRYTIVSADAAPLGVVVGNSVVSNGTTAYARDAGQNLVTGTFTPPSTSGIIVDAVLPTIVSAVPSTVKSYVNGEVIEVTVTYSENVTVDTSGGTPYISLDFDQGTDNLAYASGSGSTALVFSRTLTGAHFDMTGLSSSVGSITLNGGTIEDDGGNTAPTTFGTPINLSSMYVTYPEVKFWVKSNFTNLAPPTGAPSASNGGSITTTGCGGGTCRVFNGDDSLGLGGSISNATTVMMAFVAPTSIMDHNILGSGVRLLEDIPNSAFDLETLSATVTLDGAGLPGSTNYDIDMSPGSGPHLLIIDFDSPETISAGTLINSSFNGAVGEVIIIQGTLTGPERTNILNHLSSY